MNRNSIREKQAQAMKNLTQSGQHGSQIMKHLTDAEKKYLNIDVQIIYIPQVETMYVLFCHVPFALNC